MTASHIFYIPVVLLAGLVAGFIWGRGAALREVAAKERLQRERDEAREARRQRRQAERGAAAPDTDTSTSDDDAASAPSKDA